MFLGPALGWYASLCNHGGFLLRGPNHSLSSFPLIFTVRGSCTNALPGSVGCVVLARRIDARGRHVAISSKGQVSYRLGHRGWRGHLAGGWLGAGCALYATPSIPKNKVVCNIRERLPTCIATALAFSINCCTHVGSVWDCLQASMEKLN